MMEVVTPVPSQPTLYFDKPKDEVEKKDKGLIENGQAEKKEIENNNDVKKPYVSIISSCCRL